MLNLSISLLLVRRVSRGRVQPIEESPHAQPIARPEGDKTMRFLCLYKPAQPDGTHTTQQMEDMGKLIEKSMKSGELLATEGCLPSALGARIRLSGGVQRD